ncbi:hypothetical protein Agub_g12509 [Astrephomene gubernaculifera]|uniref:Uncharacterized protein n=1 Tax=Astrephomene gubernaculifera TaxID=47775 RepID=A0AAD3HRU8_9CHLO|nr:hypothetical protein Agub_g12509 [Astrephomene gubernaculifera]
MSSSYSQHTGHGFIISAVLLLLLRFAFSNGIKHDRAAAVMKCFDGVDCLSKRTAWEHLTEDLPSCLVAARVWWSSRPAAIPVTLVTQLSAERLDQLRAQCATWSGPLAAALYLPLLNPSSHELQDTSRQKLQAMIASAEELFKASETNQLHTVRLGNHRSSDGAISTSTNSSSGSGGGGAGGCQLRLILIYELFADPRALVLYPVNSLRNYARLLADTDLITNIDVDMLPSASISAALADPALRATYQAGAAAGGVYVWPAFETHCGGTSYADAVALADKAALPAALRKCLRRMRPKAPASHNATDYERWMATDGVYDIQYGALYEPWFLSWRWGTLWYDYRYRGYGKNKIVQAAATNATGAAWHVSPHGFLVHRPHSESRARRDFLRAKFSRKDMEDLRGSLYEHVEALWAGTTAELAAGSYMARVERPFQACLEALPWWRKEQRR